MHPNKRRRDLPGGIGFSSLPSGVHQPITNAFRGADNRIYLAIDAVGGESVLWASDDGGRTWLDTGGRTAGRHTTFVMLKDGGILGLGGKNTDIEGHMPRAISHDGGKTWMVGKTPFPAQEFEMNEAWILSDAAPTLQAESPGGKVEAGSMKYANGDLKRAAARQETPAGNR